MKKNAAVKVMTPQRERGSIAESMESVLKNLGENPEREGLLRTPERSEKALRFLLSGYNQSIGDIVNGALFHVKTDEMVIVKDIEFYSLCEHHMLPFFGKMHVAYLPNNRVIGLSKIPRIVDMFARRLQVQERLTQEGIPYESGIAQYKEIARGQLLGDEIGMLKMLIHQESHTILGVHVIGSGATELVHIGQAVMAFQGTVEHFVNTVFNYPTLAECYKVAALNGLNKLRNV